MSVTGFQAAVATLVSHALGLRSSSKPDAKSRQHSLSRGSATRRARTCAEEELLVVAKGVAVGDAHEAVDDDDQPVLAGHPHSLALAVHAQAAVPIENLRAAPPRTSVALLRA